MNMYASPPGSSFNITSTPFGYFRRSTLYSSLDSSREENAFPIWTLRAIPNLNMGNDIKTAVLPEYTSDCTRRGESPADRTTSNSCPLHDLGFTFCIVIAPPLFRVYGRGAV